MLGPCVAGQNRRWWGQQLQVLGFRHCAVSVSPKATVVKETGGVYDAFSPSRVSWSVNLYPAVTSLVIWGMNALLHALKVQQAALILSIVCCVDFHSPEWWQPASPCVGQYALVIRGCFSFFRFPPTSLTGYRCFIAPISRQTRELGIKESKACPQTKCLQYIICMYSAKMS